MEDLLAAILSKDCQLTTCQPVLVGVSGGPDSLCLMDCLDRQGFPVLAAHLNHTLRPEAEQEAQWVAHTAQERGLEFILGKEDTTLRNPSRLMNIHVTLSLFRASQVAQPRRWQLLTPPMIR
jgi:tRNA(Ile)-lysidine synthase